MDAALGGAAGQGGYNVTATIMPDNVTGQYNSSTGVHAEIDAITNLGAVANNKTITTNKEPCSRCAAILYLYRNQHAWTIQAPVNDRFAKDYAGAYHIPDAILNAMIDHLVNQGGIMSAYEGQHYKTEVKNAIDNLNV
jgi:tRNA(Arg) A34 adenosine deaminase TadA